MNLSNFFKFLSHAYNNPLRITPPPILILKPPKHVKNRFLSENYLSVVNLHVLLEITFLREGCGSLSSLEGPDSQMHSGVVEEVPDLIKDSVSPRMLTLDQPLLPPWPFAWNVANGILEIFQKFIRVITRIISSTLCDVLKLLALPLVASHRSCPLQFWTGRLRTIWEWKYTLSGITFNTWLGN